MDPKLLTIYRASAGTGKTYTLARSFVELALLEGNPYAFARILAVTFTRKATAEMKNRIIQFLAILSRGGDSPLMRHIQHGLSARGWDRPPDEICRRAGDLLHVLLHEYSRFSVSTIDSFIKNMATSLFWELQISPEITVRLDELRMLDEAVEALLTDLRPGQGDDGPFYHFLLDYMRERMRDEGRKSPFAELRDVGAQLFREPFVRKSLSEQDELLDLGAGLAARDRMREMLRMAGTEGVDLAQRLLRLVEDGGLVEVVQKRVLTQLGVLSTPDGWKDLNSVPAFTQNPEALFKKAFRDEGILAQVDGILSGLRRRIIIARSLRIVLKSYDKFLTLAHIRKTLREIERRDHVLPLREFSVILLQLKGRDDISFIYERMGQRFHSLFIDEFQDTNRLQWDLLRPLVEHSLSLGHHSLIVGDVKQSIYRWNGGDWKLLADEVAQEKTLAPYVHEVSLDRNFRSEPAIVEFNNLLFRELSAPLEDYASALLEGHEDLIARFHAQVRQLAVRAYDLRETSARDVDVGTVEITYQPWEKSEEAEELAPDRAPIQWTVRRVRQLVRDGVRPGQIAVIVRTRHLAGQIVRSLLESHDAHPIAADFSVVSQDGLLLSSSYCVNLAMAALRLVAGLGTDIDRALLAEILSTRSPRGEHAPHWAMDLKSGAESTPSPELRGWLDALYRLRANPLLTAFDRICDLLLIPDQPGQKPYVDKLRDLIYVYARSESNSLQAFVQWYDAQPPEAHAVDLVQSPTAVNVLTVHKAKGLEFDYVLCPDPNYPVAAAPSQQPFVWVEAGELLPERPGLQCAVRVSKSNLDTVFEPKLSDDFFLQIVDALNLLYVAFTRPRRALFFLYRPQVSARKEEYHLQERSRGIIDTAFRGALAQIFGEATLRDLLPRDEPLVCTVPLGRGLSVESEPVGAPVATGELRSLSWLPATDRARGRELDLALSIGPGESLESAHSRRRAILLGERMHAVMASYLLAPESGRGILLERELEVLVRAGICASAYAEWLREHLPQLIAMHEPLRLAFAPGAEVYVERELLLPGGEVRRPDLVAVLDGWSLVLDYKFGAPESGHSRQVQEYVHCVRELGLPNPRGFLLYLGPQHKTGELVYL